MCSAIELNDLSFSFKDVCRVANDIKPDNWYTVASDQRVSFIEITLPLRGPAVPQRQLIVNKNCILIEAYVGTHRICDYLLGTDEVHSVEKLAKVLKTFAGLGVCEGNCNFPRPAENGAAKYWRHEQCIYLYSKRSKLLNCLTCSTLDEYLPANRRKSTPRKITGDTGMKRKVKVESGVTGDTEMKKKVKVESGEVTLIEELL